MLDCSVCVCVPEQFLQFANVLTNSKNIGDPLQNKFHKDLRRLVKIKVDSDKPRLILLFQVFLALFVLSNTVFDASNPCNRSVKVKTNLPIVRHVGTAFGLCAFVLGSK